jgi:hypothetical protein
MMGNGKKGQKRVGETMHDKVSKEVLKYRDSLSGYSDSDKAVLELINHLMKRYGITIYELDGWDEHVCE